MNENTSDLSRLGYREIAQLAELLKVYADNGSDFLDSGVHWEYNPNSDNLFLVDEDYNVGIINPETGKLEQWLNCSNCGREGFASEFKLNDEQECPECEKVNND